jgi:hypothetical protein
VTAEHVAAAIGIAIVIAGTIALLIGLCWSQRRPPR